ncbi:MAG TPA: Xaa-Pro peptidase family protein [Xanthobacteraceae bacterium]|nr:Xaa-Pro peptidase family protein [Xanthobacteraceae bacterium]
MLTAATRTETTPVTPFDSDRLDRLMEEAGMDAVLVTSKHNVQYLLGGHRALFFDYMDAMGVSRYLPVMIYPKGRPEQAAYIGHRLEGHQKEVRPLWTPTTQMASSSSVDAIEKAITHLRRIGIKPRRLGIEAAFLPVDAAAALHAAFPKAEAIDAVFVLERLRALKRPEELELLRTASELVIDSMEAVIAQHGPGSTKKEIAEALRREETERGLVFEYCLIAAGSSHNRAPSQQEWREGDVLSVDSGGNYHGYIGDLARMAILGEPDAELEDLLADIEEIQRAAMKPIRAGAMGAEIYAAGEARLAKSRQHNSLEFLAHGMGLVSHEAPHLTASGPVPYGDDDARRPLEEGMVISVETTLHHPRRGFIKLEDTVAVTPDGHEVYGDRARGWNRGGIALR